MPNSDARAHSRPTGPIVAVLAFAGMGASFMQTILLPIQSELPALLGASRENTAWVITATLLVSTICTPISGKLGDMYGKRRVALALLGLLVAGSVIAALSTSVGPLIAGRALQGTGMGVIPLGISILRDTLPMHKMGSAIALVSATLGVGGALGLPISAFVTENYDWHVLFWLAAAIGIIAIALYALVVPASTLRSGGRVDIGGAIGLALGLTGVLLGISKGNEWGWSSVPILSLIIGGTVILLAWGKYELQRRDPLVDLRVSARGPVLMTNLASAAMGFALFASSIVFPQLLQLPASVGGLGLSLIPASFALMPSGLAMLAMSPIAGRLERLVGAKPLLVTGAVIIAMTYLVAVFADMNVWVIVIVNIVIGIGIGLGYAAMPTLIMQAVPASETGAANGLNTLMRAFGTSIASAVVAGVIAQTATIVDGTSLPTLEGFQLALILGLIASIVCAVLAFLIPRARIGQTKDASLPDGV